MSIQIPIKCRGSTPAKEFMKCASCGSINTGVLRSGAASLKGLNGIGRERFCRDCNDTFKTIELSQEAIAVLSDLIELPEGEK